MSGTYEEIDAQKDALGDAFLRVNLKCGGPFPGLGDQVRALLPNALEVRLDYPREETQTETRIRGLTPREQYAHYLREKQGADPDRDELDLFESLLMEVAR